MGLFGKLFGKKPAKPPVWARAAFKHDIASFEAFVDTVATVRDEREYAFSDDDIRSGSAIFTVNNARCEWIFEDLAAECATTAVTEWRKLVERSDPAGDADGNGDELDALPAPPSNKAWVIGTAAWGGVLLEAGKSQVVLIVLPIIDRAPLAALPTFPPNVIAAVIVCNTGDVGHLAATAIAKAAGVDHVLALDPAKPVDRGEPGTIAVRAFEKASFGPLKLERSGGNILGTWPNNTVLVGPTISLAMVGSVKPNHIVGRVFADVTQGSGDLVDALLGLRKVVLVANVPDANARPIAEMFATMGVTTEISNEVAEPLSRKMQIIAYALMDELDKADAIAVEGIAKNEAAADMHYQRAMLALMRNDEPLADAELALVGTPQALTSRMTIAGMRGDPVARELAKTVLEQLPGDPIAIRSAIAVHFLTGDPDGAKQLLAEYGNHLDLEVRIGLEKAIADPTSIALERRHVFPEHAEIALKSITPMIDAGQLEAAAKLLRKARTWDPSNIAITAELGVALAQQNKFGEAIAVYNETIDRGGSAVLLRFNRGNCYLNLGKLDEAEADYRACLEIKPDWDGPRQNLAAIQQLNR
jgi:tetratricopeptide (TPR) repeat protein